MSRVYTSPALDQLTGATVEEMLRLDAATAQDFAAVTGHGYTQLEAGLAPPLLCVRALPLAGAALATRYGMGEGLAVQQVAQEIVFEQPLPLDADIEVAARVAEVGDCGTRQGMRVATELSVAGRRAVEMTTTVTGGPALGEGRLAIDISGLRPDERLAQASTEIAPDLPERYARASGDLNPLHLDDAIARAFGFPGVIVHGMATVALSLAAATDSCPAIAAGAPSRLSARMARPMFPGSTINTSVFSTQTPGAFRLQVASGGADVLKNVALWVR